MAGKKPVQAPPSIRKCLQELESIVRSMPAGDAKKRAREALRSLSQALAGHRPKSAGKRICPPGTALVHS